MLNQTRLLLIVACTAAAPLLTGCQGSVTAAPQPAPVANQAPAGLPALPAADAPAVLPRTVAAQNNIWYGSQAVETSAAGATPDGLDLDLAPAAGATAWGMWCWGSFTPGLKPLELVLEAGPDGDSEYWLLLSNFSTGQWDVHGPLTDMVSSFVYWAGADYLSASGYTYAAIAAVGGNSLSVYQLNLKADEDVTPPAIPQGVGAYSPQSTSITVYWDANEEADLWRYYVYSGPEVDFDIRGEESELRGFANSFEQELGVSGLTPNQTYHFRVTALDSAQNESLPSATVTVTTPAVDPRDPPRNLTVDDLSSFWADLSWQPPEDATGLQGYEVYTGPVDGFTAADDGVEKRHEGLITETAWRMTDLLAETEYYVGVRAYYSGAQSAMSNTPSVTTLSSAPPVPAFSYDPPDVVDGLPVTFDPSGTTDVDTPVEELIFKWDFTDDGTVDRTTTGPQDVAHTYDSRGPVTARLTVTDGNYVSTTDEIDVGMHYEYFQAAQATGLPGSVVNLDADSASGRIAALQLAGGTPQVRLYNGTSWSVISGTALAADYLCDVAVNASSVAALVADQNGTDIDWTVYEHGGSNWSSAASGQATGDQLALGRLDLSTAGRVAVGLLAGSASGSDTDYTIYLWHEQAGGGFSTANTAVGTNTALPLDLQRDDTASRFVYTKPGEIHQWSFTDASDTDQSFQACSGNPVLLTTGSDPADLGHVYWACATDGDRLYYGDNYGVANAADQYVELDYAATALLGVGLTASGDNESLFYWTDYEPNATEYLRGYDSTGDAGRGEWYEILTGVGAATGGAGAYFDDGADAGVYTACTETRDGECRGRFLQRGATLTGTALYTPTGNGNILDRHASLLLTDSALLSLSEQPYPSARGSQAAGLGQPLTFTDVGSDAWCTPDAACPMSYAGDYLIGSYTDSGELVITWFLPDMPDVIEAGLFSGTSLAVLAYNYFSGTNTLCYATNGGTSIEIRTWSGSAWSEATGVFSGAAVIDSLAVAPGISGYWGIAAIDADDNVWLVESGPGGWDTPELISTTSVNNSAGVGLDYHAEGGLCVVLERATAEPGIHLGVRPAGGSFSWERIAVTSGSDSNSLFASYHLAEPLVLFYQTAAPLEDSRMQLVEKLDGAWTLTELPDQLHGSPVGISRNLGGDIVLTGYRIDGPLQRAAIGILYR